MMKSEMDEVGMSLNVAIQLAEVASDWGLDEIEVDGEMERVYDIYERLCAARDLVDVVLAYLDTLPAAPAPDWSKAPDWAMWWAVEPCGEATWYSEKPVMFLTIDRCGWDVACINGTPQGTWRYAEGSDLLPIGIDWRTTLQARPTETP